MNSGDVVITENCKKPSINFYTLVFDNGTKEKIPLVASLLHAQFRVGKKNRRGEIR